VSEAKQSQFNVSYVRLSACDLSACDAQAGAQAGTQTGRHPACGKIASEAILV